MLIGYARVSTKDQNVEIQIELLKKQGCDKVFSDVASGVNDNRPGLQGLLNFARSGDVVVVYKTDRIFRSLKNMVNLIDIFNENNIQFKSITEPQFDTTSSNGRLFLQIFAAIAEFERNLISERTKTGLEGARLRKKLLGRPKGHKKSTIDKYTYANHLYINQKITIDEACKKANISKTTFYRIEKNEKREIN